MNKKELEVFTKQAAKGIKSEADLNAFRAMLTKVTVGVALNAELEYCKVVDIQTLKVIISIGYIKFFNQ